MGFDAYNEYAEFIKDNMAALLDSLTDVLDGILVNIAAGLDEDPDDEALSDWKLVLDSLHADFEKMQKLTSKRRRIYRRRPATKYRWRKGFKRSI